MDVLGLGACDEEILVTHPPEPRNWHSLFREGLRGVTLRIPKKKLTILIKQKNSVL